MFEATVFEEDHDTCNSRGGCDTCLAGKVLTRDGKKLMELVLKWLPMFAHTVMDIGDERVTLSIRTFAESVDDSTN